MAREHFKFKDVSVSQFLERLGDNNSLLIIDVINNYGFYHLQCCQEMTNKETLKRTEKQFNEVIRLAMLSASKRKKGRPSMKYLTAEKEERVTRSQSVPYEKSLCIICQKIGGQLHKVEMKETG